LILESPTHGSARLSIGQSFPFSRDSLTISLRVVKDSVVPLLMLNRLLEPKHKYSLAHTERISKCIRETNTKKEVAAMPDSASASSWRRASPRTATHCPSLIGDVQNPFNRTTGRTSPSKLPGRNVCSEVNTQDDDSSNDSSVFLGKDHPDMDFLLSDARGEGDCGKTQLNGEAAWIQQ
jgi:hypothetical protein